MLAAESATGKPVRTVPVSLYHVTLIFDLIRVDGCASHIKLV
jgi:hypothetical protein